MSPRLTPSRQPSSSTVGQQLLAALHLAERLRDAGQAHVCLANSGVSLEFPGLKGSGPACVGRPVQVLVVDGTRGYVTLQTGGQYVSTPAQLREVRAWPRAVHGEHSVALTLDQLRRALRLPRALHRLPWQAALGVVSVLGVVLLALALLGSVHLPILTLAATAQLVSLALAGLRLTPLLSEVLLARAVRRLLPLAHPPHLSSSARRRAAPQP